MVGVCVGILLLPLVARCLETIDVCIWAHICFYVCCSDCGNVCLQVHSRSSTQSPNVILRGGNRCITGEEKRINNIKGYTNKQK